MPVYLKGACSFAVVSSRLLSQLVESIEIPWRNEWGSREEMRVKVPSLTLDTGAVVGLGGISELLLCLDVSRLYILV